MALLNGLVETVVEDVVGRIVSPPLLIIGAIVATPFVAPGVSKKMRPVAKQIIKGGLWTVEKGKELFGEIGEQFSDLVAESRAELAAAAAASASAKSGGEETAPAEATAEVTAQAETVVAEGVEEVKKQVGRKKSS